MPKSNYPALSPNRDSYAELWVRLEAFLSMRAPATYSTYLGVLKEWSKFLGAELGTPRSGDLLTSANDLHAMAYLTYLGKRPGERPRSLRDDVIQTVSQPKSKQRAVQINRITQRTKKTGLESTQSNSTIAKKIAALRRIYRMLISAKLFREKNPFDTDTLKTPPKESGRKRPTEMISFTLVKKILNTPDGSTDKGRQDRAILACLFGGALRRGEVCGLRLGDVRRSTAGTTFLHLRATKAGKDANQTIPNWAAKSLAQQIDFRRKNGARDNDFVFCSFRGKGGMSPTNKPISPSGVYKLFTAVTRHAIGEGWFTPHSARATAITKLLSDGVAHREVKEFSRHASIQMVEVYDKRRMSVDDNPGKGLDFEDD